MGIDIQDHGEQNRVDIPPTAMPGDMKVVLHGNHNHFTLNGAIQPKTRCLIDIQGDHNSITLGTETSFGRESKMKVLGDYNSILIGDTCHGHIKLRIQTTGATFQLGDDATMLEPRFVIQEPYRIVVGKDCLFSRDVWVSVSDMHGIFDIETGERVNAGRDVIIGDHVWFGHHTKVLKGVQIGSGSVIGTGAVVTKDIPENCVAAGTPAKVTRERIYWTRDIEGKTLYPSRAPHR